MYVCIAIIIATKKYIQCDKFYQKYIVVYTHPGQEMVSILLETFLNTFSGLKMFELQFNWNIFWEPPKVNAGLVNGNLMWN